MSKVKKDDHEALSLAYNHIITYLDGLDTAPVGATASLHELRNRFSKSLPEKGLKSTEVVSDLIENTAGGLLGCAGGRFYAWVIGGGVPSALAADWLTSTWDQNAALYACGPAASVVEETAGEWLKQLFGLPLDASFAFTTGCQLAHFTSLAAARYVVLKSVGWDVNEDGLFGAPAVRIVVSDQRHASVDRAVRYLGFGNRSIIPVPTDEDGKIDIEEFTQLLDQKCPTIVVLDAADLNIAAVDPFQTLIPIAKAVDAWVHIDGAFGLFATASESKRHIVRGIELADSWATDGHKWLNVPFDCGFAFIRDREAHRKSMTITASYIEAASATNNTTKSDGSKPARDQIDWNPEWSRKARGFPVYAALREMGREGVQDLVDRCCQYCEDLVRGMGDIPGAEVLWAPTLNQGLVRFLDPAEGATVKEHNLRTAAVLTAINASGKAFFSGTTWRNMYAIRISVVNWRTSAEDVLTTIAAVREAVRDTN